MNQRKQPGDNRQALAVIFAAVFIYAGLSYLPATGKNKAEVDGKGYFQQRCASCHSGGSNAVKPSRPVAGSKVLSNLATFKGYLGKPPGHMPSYEDLLKNPDMLKKLYDYCRTLKATPIRQANADSAMTESL